MDARLLPQIFEEEKFFTSRPLPTKKFQKEVDVSLLGKQLGHCLSYRIIFYPTATIITFLWFLFLMNFRDRSSITFTIRIRDRTLWTRCWMLKIEMSDKSQKYFWQTRDNLKKNGTQKKWNKYSKLRCFVYLFQFFVYNFKSDSN